MFGLLVAFSSIPTGLLGLRSRSWSPAHDPPQSTAHSSVLEQGWRGRDDHRR